MNPNLTEKLLTLRALRTPEADKICEQIIKDDWHFDPTCRNCKHLSTTSNWCKKIKFHVDHNKEEKCFDPIPEFIELSKLKTPTK